VRQRDAAIKAWLPAFSTGKLRATLPRLCRWPAWALWAGADLRTVQLWMGHTDMESTMRYLKLNRGQAVREKDNAMFRLAVRIR